jgi:hypothetical protein
MTDQLIDLAERFLRRLEKSLLPIPAFRRDAILLHYRNRLSTHSRLGYEALREAVKELGSAEEIAARYLEAERASPTPDLSASRAIIPMPGHRNLPALLGQLSCSPRSLLEDIKASLAATRKDLFAICGVMLAMFVGLSTLASYHALVGSDFESRAWDLVFGVLVVSVTMTALLRAALRRTDLVWEIGQPLITVTAIVATIAVTSAALSFLISLPVASLLEMVEVRPAANFVADVTFDAIAMLLVVGASLRLMPWAASRAIGRDDLSVRTCLQRTWRHRNSMIKGWAVFVLPLFVVHTALRATAMADPAFGGFQLAMGGVDAIVSTVMMLMAGMLLCIAYRWVAGEAIPEPLPFAPGVPTESQVRAARARLDIARDTTRSKPAVPLFGGTQFTGFSAKDNRL